MPNARDPTALLRHAAGAGDWQLVALIGARLAGEQGTGDQMALRAYRTLTGTLDLRNGAQDYHRT